MKQCMDSENLHRRLKKIIGQVQAIDRMIDEDVPCEDVLAQINAAKSALHGCGGFCRSAGAAGQNGGKQQSGKRQCKKFFHFGVLLSVRCSGAENFCPGAWVCDLY